MSRSGKQLLTELFLGGLEEMHPSILVRQFLEGNGNSAGIQEGRIYILASGKAALPMARAAAEVLQVPHSRTLVITPVDYSGDTEKLEIFRSTHPVPDEKSLEAGRRAVEFVRSIPRGSTLLALISGGTSSLLCYPLEGIEASDLATLNRLLLRSGADIHRINAIRKHFSRIKGGKLLEYLEEGVTVRNLIISDVPGDDPALVGSGSTVNQEGTDSDKIADLLRDLGIYGDLPEIFIWYLETGTGEMKRAQPPTQSNIIGSARQLAEVIAERAGERGLTVSVAEEAYSGDVQAVMESILREADRNDAELQVHYGESSVKVTGSGKGGRNQELALRASIAIAGRPITWLSAGTDGIDGPTDAAGAVVDGEIQQVSRGKGLDARRYVSNNDSHTFHRQMGTLLKTGPTGNNLMDIQLILTER